MELLGRTTGAKRWEEKVDDMVKRCSKCGEKKVASCFGVRAGAPDGRRGVCRDCKRAGHKSWRDANREHVRAYRKEAAKRSYASDPQKYRDKAKAAYHADPQKAAIYRRKNYLAHKHDRCEYAKTYRKSHLEQCAERMRVWRNRNKEKLTHESSEHCRLLSDAYIAKVLGMKISEVPKPLIEAQRVRIKIKRFLKEIKQ